MCRSRVDHGVQQLTSVLGLRLTLALALALPSSSSLTLALALALPSSSSSSAVCRSRVDHRVQQLTSVLVHELKISPERSIKGGRRSARRAVAQLIRLGKSVQVRDVVQV